MVDFRKVVIVVLVIIIGAVIGLLITSWQADKTNKSSNHNGVGIRLNLRVDIESHNGTNTTNYIVRAAIQLRGNGANKLNNSTLCAYTSNGTILNSTVIRELEVFEEENVNMPVESRPTYIMVDHPQVHAPRYNKSGIRVSFWERDQSTYVTQWLEQTSLPFEYPRQNVTGRCR